MRTRLSATLLAAAIAGASGWGPTSAAILKEADRKFPLQFCPMDFEGWNDGAADLSFVAPASNIRITFSTPNFFGGNHVDTHLDNVVVVLKDAFGENLHVPFGPPPPEGPDGYWYCNFPPNTDPDETATNARSFVFTNFSEWPGAGGPLLQRFDTASEVDCWSGDVYFDATLTAPREPATEDDLTGGSLGIGTPEDQGVVTASRIVTGLDPGEEYVVFAWWHAAALDETLVATSLTIAIDSACIDGDGDGFVDCSGCTPCVLEPGNTCGECDDADPTIRPGVADASCDGIDQDCSGLPDDGFPQVCQCTRRAADIAGWWPGDAGVTDLAADNDGTLVSGAVAAPGGVAGDAFWFNFAQGAGVELPDDDALEFTSQMTLEAWVRPDDIEASRPIISKLGSPGDHAYALHAEPGGSLASTISANGIVVDALASPPGLLQDSRWAHVATTFDAGAWALWVDGEVVATKTSTVTSLWDLGAATPGFGRAPEAANQLVVDEPAMYERALTSAEIRAIHAANAAGAVGLHGRWPADGDANDATFSSNDGTLQNGVTFVDGVVGSAFHFDGVDDTIGNIGTPSSYAFVQNTRIFTIDAWIDLDDPDAFRQQGITGNTQDTLEKGHTFLWDNLAGFQRLKVVVFKGVAGVPVLEWWSPDHVISTSGWHHVAVVADGASVVFWVDGEPRPGVGWTNSPSTGSSTFPLQIGVASLPFEGSIDEVHIWSRALDAAEIRQMMRGIGMCHCLDDGDGDGYGTEGGASCPSGAEADCDDGDPTIHAGATEACNGADDDCDTVLDDGLPQQTFYRDIDGDGHGWTTPTIQACALPPGYAATSTDCNDNAAAIHPGAAELCNGIDDDCDGTFDDGLPQSTFYRDADGDGYGAPATTTQACAAPAGYAASSTDCNDGNAAIHPGTADAICDGVDENCNGGADEGFASPPDGWFDTPLAGAPSARRYMTMVSTGNSVIVWGGMHGATTFNSGGIYRPRDPAADTWTATTTSGAPSARYEHTAVWTGTEMIVWGGFPGALNTGGRYNPATDAWTATNTVGAPAGRFKHTAVWTSSKMIVWGGAGTTTGGVYDPAANSWTATALTGAPPGNIDHTAVWTGTQMIVWGGHNGGGPITSGARYNPGANSWTTMAAAPLAARYAHTAVWTGSRMIVWGGTTGGSSYFSDGAAYDPALNQWTPIAASGLVARAYHTAVWDTAAGRMVVWGGRAVGSERNDGAAYDPSSNTWSPLPSTGAPAARLEHVGAWLSATRELVVWGGFGSIDLASGGRIVVAPFTCGAGVCARPSGYTCSSGQLGYGCPPGPPPPSGRPSITESRQGPDATISWAPISGATGYDVVSGSLSLLRSSSGNYTVSTSACIDNDVAGSSSADTSSPSPGQGTWHLVRAVHVCNGPGSYDETSPGQQGNRDAEIAAAPAACP